eukprot:9206573-Pyramimonas_sp.AAC.1
MCIRDSNRLYDQIMDDYSLQSARAETATARSNMSLGRLQIYPASPACRAPSARQAADSYGRH